MKIAPADCLVLIPAYRAGPRLPELLHAVADQGFPVLVVDDGSKDDTAKKAKEAGAFALVSDTNEGKGAALRKGLEWFLKKNYAGVVLMDADGQHDPKELSLFIRALNETDWDFVIGNRMQDPQGMPWLRRATNRFLSWLLSFVCGQSVPDSQCGFRALTYSVVKHIRLSTSRFEIESEMILSASALGYRIGSIPIRSVYESGVSSQIDPVKDTLRFFKFLTQHLLFQRKSS
jgi:glycosyltransferase involved in cell wall biosynthesis